MKRKVLLIGAESFSDYFSTGRESYYVDKSLFIKELVDAGFLDRSPQLILRPRRFGKTLNLSMLKTFFDISEKENAWMFSGLYISEYAEICQQHQNKYPVISVSFKDTGARDYGNFLLNLNDRLKSEVLRYEDAVRYDGKRAVPLAKDDKASLLRIADGEGTERDLRRCLIALTTALHGYYGIRPLVLIDEYDAPLNDAYENDFFPIVMEIMRSMFSSGLKTNENLGGVVITGILKIAKNNLFSGLNNLVVNSVAGNDGYPDSFGFSQLEVDQMLSYYDLEEKRQTLKDWYDGYHIGDRYVYNPFSLASAVSHLNRDKSGKTRPGNHWAESAGTRLLRQMLGSCKGNTLLKQQMDSLLELESVDAEYTTDVIYSEILDNPKTITGTMLLSGYLTLDDNGKLRVPNKEVLSCFESLVSDYNREYDQNTLPELLKAYIDGDQAKAKELLDKYFAYTLRTRDLDNSENNYHYFICGAMSQVTDRLGSWEFSSNKETRLGYADLIFTDIYGKRAIVIEEKVLKGEVPHSTLVEQEMWLERQLEKTANIAFCQIEKKGYDELYKLKGYSVSYFANVYFKHKAYVFKRR